MNQRACIRQRADQRAAAAGVIEMNMGQKQVIDLVAANTERVQRSEQVRDAVARAAVYKRGATVGHQQVRCVEPASNVIGVDRVNAVRHLLRRDYVRLR